MIVKIQLLLLFIIKIKAETTTQSNGNIKSELNDFLDQITIGKNNPIYLTDENGKISKTPFYFDPEKWNLDISITKNENGPACIFELYYLAEKEYILVKPGNKKAKKVQKKDLIYYLKKNKNFFFFERIYFEGKNLKIKKENCKVGLYKGVKQIKPVMANFDEEKVGYTHNVLQAMKLAVLNFSKINYIDFQPKPFRELADFSGSSTQKQIVKFLEEIKKNSIASVNNKVYLEIITKEILTELKSWTSKMNSFCDKFRSNQGIF
jgi:hypothetical protein